MYNGSDKGGEYGCALLQLNKMKSNYYKLYS